MNHPLTTTDQHILSLRSTRFFIALLSLIRERHVTTLVQLEDALAALPALSDQWRHISHNLFISRQESEELFWLSYDIAALDFPTLSQWRSLVAQSPSVLLPDNPSSSQKPSVVTSFQDLPDPQIDWLWQSRLPVGMLTVLDGDRGPCKSLLVSDLAARVSRGLSMPDGSPGLPAPAGVILITAEDDSPSTIRHRLLHVGADLSRVFTINRIPVTDPSTGYTYQRSFSLLDDFLLLEQAIDQAQARLLILDPTPLLFGQKDTCTAHEVFHHLSLLSALLAKKQVACLLLRHPHKGAYQTTLSHALSSLASLGLPRTELLLTNDPCHEHLSLLVHTRSILGDPAPTLSFSLSSSAPTAPINSLTAPLNVSPSPTNIPSVPSASPNTSPAPINVSPVPLSTSPAPTISSIPSLSWHGTSSYSPQQALFSLSLEPKLGALRSNIFRILQRNATKTFSPLEMAKQLPHIPLNTLQNTLRRMANDHQISQPARGQYGLFFSLSQNQCNL